MILNKSKNIQPGKQHDCIAGFLLPFLTVGGTAAG